jgi:hypothetical protein
MIKKNNLMEQLSDKNTRGREDMEYLAHNVMKEMQLISKNDFLFFVEFLTGLFNQKEGGYTK